MRSSIQLFAFVGLLAFCGVGCAHYQVNLQQPEQYATTITDKADVLVNIDPLRYIFRSVEDVLVIRIKNPTTEPIELLGNQSSAIDVSGEAHPLRSQTIPPGAFIKLIVPPPRPTVYDPGPNVSFGFGAIGRVDRGYIEDRTAPYVYDEPRTLTMSDVGNNFYWDWKANTAIKLILTYQQQGQVLHQTFTFFKQKL